MLRKVPGPAKNNYLQPIQTPCERCPFHKLPSLRKFTADELAFVKGFKRAEMRVPAGHTLFIENEEHRHIYTVLSGWAIRYKMLEDGRRQILNFALPSDFLGMQNAILKSMKQSVEALTSMTLCVFDRNQIWEIYKAYPELSFDITWIASRDECLVGENLLSVGRRTGLERVAYVLLHLFMRAKGLGLTKDNQLQLPVTQQQVADALGLSIVHTNKTIRKLSKHKLISWRQGIFEIFDLQRLSEIAMYNHEEPGPRPFI